MKNFYDTIAAFANSIQLMNIILNIIIGCVVYWVAPLLARIAVAMSVRIRGSRRIRNNSERKKRLDTLGELFTTIIKVIVVLTVVFSVLADLHVNLVPIFASAGVAGVALGFGAQNIIKDLLAGFFVIVENQYRVGDFIDVSGIGIPQEVGGGVVEKITLRSTQLRDRLGDVHFIPNGSVVEVVNKTMGYSKVHFVFAVATDTNMDKLIEIVNETGRGMMDDEKWSKKIIDAPHFSEIGKIGSEGFNVTVNGITEPAAQWSVSSEFRKRLLEQLQKNEINTVETVNS